MNQHNPYPVEMFPGILRDVVTSLHSETQFPIEMIGSIVLTAAALACQGYAEATSPFTGKAEPCSLYFLTIAPASSGKSTLYSEIMSPFEVFTKSMKLDYSEKLTLYKKTLAKWKLKESALKSNLRKAMKDGDIELEREFQELFDDHIDNFDANVAPGKPKKFNLIYEDVSFKALIDGLREQPNAAVLSSEAITFFKGRLKGHLGLLNKAWSGEVYPFHRVDEEDIELEARLTMLLMVQPQIFINYLKKDNGESTGSGFLSRFLITNTINTVSQFKKIPNCTLQNECLKKFHITISNLLDKQKVNFNDNSLPKLKSPLSEYVKDIFFAWIQTHQTFISPTQKWEHIQGHVKKAGSNAIRMATIFALFENESTTIDYSQLKKATTIVDWYTDQAGMLFYPQSNLYRFREDVYELFEWITKRINSSSEGRAASMPYPKQLVENQGPYRLRPVKVLNPVLNELIELGVFCTIQYNDSHAEYIAIPYFDPNDGGILTVHNPRSKPFAFVRTIHHLNSIPNRILDYDKERLKSFSYEFKLNPPRYRY